MRIVLQRVCNARVRVDGAVVGEVGRGLLVLVGVSGDDTAATADGAAAKLADLRCFEDEGGATNLAAREVGGEFLVVSQFTLLGSLARGRRPSFSAAAPGAQAAPLVDLVVAGLRERGYRVATGVFGAQMAVELVNDGPFTLVFDLDAAGRVVA